MLPVPFLSGRSSVERSENLLRVHGRGAAMAAKAQALAARANDNAVMYCHWRDVERLCGLPTDRPVGAHIH